MQITNLQNSRVAVVGYGIEGRASLDYLFAIGTKTVALFDVNPSTDILPDHQQQLSDSECGSRWLERLSDYDIIIKSPGIPLHSFPQSLTSRLTSGTNIFLSQYREKTIGITGTKGKSTTSSLISHLLSAAGVSNRLIGNIGTPALSAASDNVEAFVLELSSYQLELADMSPRGAVLLNLYPEHLDHHGSVDQYFSAKHNIHKYQIPGDFLVTPKSLHLENPLLQNRRATTRLIGTQDSTAWIQDDTIMYRDVSKKTHQLCPVNATLIKGPGNQQNILAALAAIQHFDVPPPTLRDAICSFQPLPHRLEPIETTGAIRFINDSISTIPESTVNALETYKGSVHTLILGGFDRGVAFDKLVAYILESNVRVILLLSPSGERIKEEFLNNKTFNPENTKLLSVSSLEEAVGQAKVVTPDDKVCLLSPASPSFPTFKNFEERGRVFRQLIQDTSRKPLL
jgi:UDP-N-acetylmuramoylalanine--D-glutamate ligase